MRKLSLSSVYSILLLATILLANPVFAKNSKSDKKSFTVTKRTLKRKNKQYIQVFDHKLNRKRVLKDSVIIKFKNNASKEDINSYLSENDLEFKRNITKDIMVCKGKQKTGFVKYIRKINNKNNDIVELIDINEVKKVRSSAIKDRRFKWRRKSAKKQWHLFNDGYNGLVAGADINVLEAWEHTKGLGVKVAVVDTGFDLGHSDINFSTEGFNALAFDPDTNPDFSAIASLADANAPRNSEENHGTAVAGIIGAKDNGKGVVGVAPESEIIPVRMINDDGEVTLEQIVMAIKQAEALGAKIINNSWGSYDPSLGPNDTLEISEMESEIYKEIATNGNNGKGVLIVFASGNSGKRNFNGSPEARSEYTIAVGATDSTDNLARYSVSGKELDFVAPGGGYKSIVTTDRRDLRIKRNGKRRRLKKGYNKGKVAKMRGTSAAAPVVSGVAALVWSINPELSASEVKDILKSTTYKNPSNNYFFKAGKSYQLGYGRVDAGKAVKAALASLN